MRNTRSRNTKSFPFTIQTHFVHFSSIHLTGLAYVAAQRMIVLSGLFVQHVHFLNGVPRILRMELNLDLIRIRIRSLQSEIQKIRKYNR